MVSLIVPVMSNFKGFTRLMHSVDTMVFPVVINNWDNNKGVAAAWNEGLRKSMDHECAIICNDDVTLCPGTIDSLVRGLYDGWDLVSAVANDTGQTGYNTEVKPDFSCFAVRPYDFVETFGWFDENFTPAYFEDNDMHYRIKVLGGKQALDLGATIHHEGSVTQFKGAGPDTEDRVVSHEQFRANLAYYCAKWGGEPGSERYTAPFNGMTNKVARDW